MADILSRLYDISGLTFQPRYVCTDGTNIFWESDDDGGSIYKYDSALNTHSKLVDSSEFKWRGIGFSWCMTFFQGKIYVGTTSNQVAPNALNYVYSVNPNNGAVVEVLSTFPRSACGETGSALVRFRLYADLNYLVAVYIEDRIGGCSDPPEFISWYSANGTSWQATTDSFSETIELTSIGLTDAFSSDVSRDNRVLGIYERYPVSGTTDIILKFESGVWSKVRGPETNTNDNSRLFHVGHDHYWNRDDFGQYTDDWSSYHQPAGQTDATVGLNMPYEVINSFDNEFVRLDADNPPTATEIDCTMDDVGIAIGSFVNIFIRLNDGTNLALLKTYGPEFPDWSIWERDVLLPPTPLAWSPLAGGSTPPPGVGRPCDIDIEGENIYIPIITSANTPMLLKFSTDLASSPEIVFNPGEGSNIGVTCSKVDSNKLWIGGDFGTDDSLNNVVLEISEDGGSTFTVIDDTTFDPVTTFIVGPDSENRILLADNTGNIRETTDGGDTWTTVKSGLSYDVKSLGRLERNINEVVLGNESGITNNIGYSIDGGANIEDYTTGDFPTDSDVSRVLVQ